MNTTVEAQREAAFQEYINSEESQRAGARIEEAGGMPWHGNDIERRRELFMRRYTRPAPPSAAIKVQR